MGTEHTYYNILYVKVDVCFYFILKLNLICNEKNDQANENTEICNK